MSANALSDVKRGWHLSGDLVPISWSKHALQRYGERIRPGLAHDQVESELCHLLPRARISRKPPPWLREGDGVRATASAYLIFEAARVVLPLVARDDELVATTTLTPNMVEGVRRERRNAQAGKRRAGKRARRLAIGDQPGAKRPPPSADEWAE